MAREIGRFIAVDVDDGTEHEVVEIEEEVDISGGRTIPGMRQLMLLDGSTVTERGSDEFLVIETGQVLRKRA